MASQESSPTPQVKSINSSALSLRYSPTLTSTHDYWKVSLNPKGCLERATALSHIYNQKAVNTLIPQLRELDRWMSNYRSHLLITYKVSNNDHPNGHNSIRNYSPFYLWRNKLSTTHPEDIYIIGNRVAMSNSFWPHGLQHTSLLCPLLSPRVCSN